MKRLVGGDESVQLKYIPTKLLYSTETIRVASLLSENKRTSAPSQFLNSSYTSKFLVSPGSISLSIPANSSHHAKSWRATLSPSHLRCAIAIEFLPFGQATAPWDARGHCPFAVRSRLPTVPADRIFARLLYFSRSFDGNSLYVAAPSSSNDYFHVGMLLLG